MIKVQAEDFNLDEEYQALRRQAGDAGAIVTFSGLVREMYDSDTAEKDKTQSLTLEHYPGMTQASLAAIVAEAEQRWELLASTVIHRVGELHAGDQIVFVGVASAHRHAAFDAAQFIMDYLKSKAPFWKKQLSNDGESQWVESRVIDTEALARWEKPSK